MSFLGSRRRVSRGRNIGHKNDILNYHVFDDIEGTTDWKQAFSGGSLEHRETGEKIQHMRPSVFAEKAKNEIVKLRFQIKLLKEGRNPDLDKIEDMFKDCENYFIVQNYNLNNLNVNRSKNDMILSETSLNYKIWIGTEDCKVVAIITKYGYFKGNPQVPTADIVAKIFLEKEDEVFSYKFPAEYYELVGDILKDIKKSKMAKELMK